MSNPKTIFKIKDANAEVARLAALAGVPAETFIRIAEANVEIRRLNVLLSGRNAEPGKGAAPATPKVESFQEKYTRLWQEYHQLETSQEQRAFYVQNRDIMSLSAASAARAREQNQKTSIL